MENNNQIKYIIKYSKFMALGIKIVYVMFAVCFVSQSFYKIVENMSEGNVLVKEELRVLPKIRYPSLTFCYKYVHGSKHAIQTYNSYFIEKWKGSG